MLWAIVNCKQLGFVGTFGLPVMRQLVICCMGSLKWVCLEGLCLIKRHLIVIGFSFINTV